MSKAWPTLHCIAALCLCLLVPASAVYAQSYDNPSLGQKPVAAFPQDSKPLGIRAGSFMLHPGVELAVQWHDNVFFTRENEISDTIFHIRPYITAQSNWSRHSLTVYLAADIARYKDRDILDYEDYFFNLAGTFDVHNRAYFSYGFDYMDLHENRNVVSSDQGIEPTRYNLTSWNVGYDQVFNRLAVGARYTWRKLDYENSLGLEGEIDNQDRDREMNIVMARLGYQFQTDKQAFFSATWRETNFDEPFDRNGLHRDSDGYDLRAGVLFEITAVLSGDVSVAYHKSRFDDPRLEDIDGWSLGAGLTWMPTQLTSVYARIQSSIEDTTRADSSGYLRTLYSVRVDHELTRELQLSAQASYNHNDYQLIGDVTENTRTKDKYWRFGIGLNYFFNRYVRLSASYDYSKLRSNLDNDGFDANRVWLVLGIER